MNPETKFMGTMALIGMCFGACLSVVTPPIVDGLHAGITLLLGLIAMLPFWSVIVESVYRRLSTETLNMWLLWFIFHNAGCALVSSVVIWSVRHVSS